MRRPRACGPGGEHPGGQIHQRDQSDNGKAAAGFLHGLLWKGFLVGPGIRRGDRGAIHDQDVMSAPQVFDGHTSLGLGAQILMNLLESFQRQAAPGLAVGAIAIGRQGEAGVLA
jgi:hypothetical protein